MVPSLESDSYCAAIGEVCQPPVLDRASASHVGKKGCNPRS